MEILFTILPYLTPLIFGVLGILALVLLRKGIDFVGIKRSQKVDEMIDRYVDIGVDYAEVAATKFLQAHQTKMSGESKQAKAVHVVMDELKQSGVTDVARELVVSRIESALVNKGLNPGVPSDPEEGGES